MTGLNWRDGKHDDLAALMLFECTEPPLRSAETGWKDRHLRDWELQVQRAIRGLRKIPTRASPYRLRVGELPDLGLVVAVSYYRKVGGARQVQLLLGAVALPLQENGYGAELIEDTLDVITEDALLEDVDEVLITGRIHKDNVRSQAMCARVGFEFTGDVNQAGGQEWSRRLPIAGAELAGGDPAH